MSAVLGWLAALDWNAILQIILIDILLGGDNAVIIALACRNLPARQRRAGIIWGAAGAIVLRVILITVAVALLQVPFLKLIGGVLLLWIGIKLIAPADEGHGHGKLEGSDKLLAAIKTIIVADFVMSLDNVIAIAGAAEQADPSQRTGLIIFGLLVSVPFIVFGAQIILKLLDRFPMIVTAGAALLGWIAGGLIVGDPIAEPVLPPGEALKYVASAVGAVLVVVAGRWLARRRAAAGTPAQH
ncbi:MAG: rane protein [Burkholderiaceae bacterium]|jgi:YjbE family integral membrane protein|nr:rane protein [Burkholderiaceae bacterium]